MIIFGPAITIDVNRIVGLDNVPRLAGPRQRSVAVAFLVGSIGLTSQLAGITDPDAGVLGLIAALDLENIGFVIVGVFAVCRKVWVNEEVLTSHGAHRLFRLSLDRAGP